MTGDEYTAIEKIEILCYAKNFRIVEGIWKKLGNSTSCPSDIVLFPSTPLLEYTILKPFGRQEIIAARIFVSLIL